MQNNFARFKFAHARGARIQLHIPYAKEPLWMGANPHGFNWSDDYEFRIHPEDTHLEYGPISSALRVLALRRLTLGNYG